MMYPNEAVYTDATAIHEAIYQDATLGVRARGAIPRPWEQCPQGFYRGEVGVHAVTDLPEISPAEFPGMIAQLEAEQSRLSDFRMKGNKGAMIPSRDQNGRGYCHSADTEVLTKNGWVAWPDYDWKSPLATVNPMTHAMEFQLPFERHIYEYDGELVHSTNRRIDFAVTPDHQMYVRKWDEAKRTLSRNYSFVRAADIGWYAGLLHAPSGQIGTELVEVEVPDDRAYDGDDFLALLGLVISDGYAGGTEKTKNWVSFASFRESSRGAVAALAARVGFHECPGRPGVWIRYNAGALARWVRETCYAAGKTGSYAKMVPDLVKCASGRQITHFLNWFDDRNRSGSQFYSTSKRLIDDLQELHLRIGKRSAIGWDDAKDVPFNNAAGVIHSKGGYVLTVGDVDRLCIDRKKHIETDRYKGTVYCAAVPNHTLLTRRNGSVLISSNCWRHSGTSAHLLIRARDDQPYLDLSPYAGACRIKNYRDEGGWGAQGVDDIMDNGDPTAEFWPQRAVSRQYDNANTWANAKLHRFTEGFIDMGSPQYDRTLTFNQVITCLLSRIPVVVDFNWWSHSVCAADAVNGTSQMGITRAESGKLMQLQEFDAYWGINNPVTGGIAIRIWNSWGDSWSTNGMGVLTGSKAVPDGATAPRVATLAFK